MAIFQQKGQAKKSRATSLRALFFRKLTQFRPSSSFTGFLQPLNTRVLKIDLLIAAKQLIYKQTLIGKAL
ncbi:MAG: hypothetical protein WC308_03550 [archaeon]|jgi:hypothetical protein